MKKNKNQRLLLVLMLLIILILAIYLIIYAVTKIGKAKNNTVQITDGDFTATLEQENTPEEKHVQVLDNGTKLNTSTKLHEEKSVDGFTFTNIQLTMTDSLTTLIADVTNTSGSDKPMTAFDIVFVDDDGNELVTFGSFINATKAGEKTSLESNGTLDYANAYDFKIIVK